MSGSDPGIQICPFCKKPFKRLKSHLPYCKMARSTDLSEDFSPAKKCSSSAVPKLLNTEKKKGQVKNTEPTSKKENKKSNPELKKNKTKGKTNSSQQLATKCSSLQKGEDTQIECTSVNTSQTGGNSQNVSEDGPATKPDEKVALEASTAERLSRIQKSRSKTTSGGAGFASHVALEPNIQSRIFTSELPSQDVKCFSEQSQNEDATLAKQNVSTWFDSSLDDLPAVPQEIDRIELVIENHRVRLLRKRSGSLVQNEVAIGNHKTGAAESSPGGEEVVSTNGQKALAVPEREAAKSILGLELVGDVLRGGTGTGVTTVEANKSDGQVMNSCGKFSRLPALISLDMKNTASENILCFKEDEYPKESPACTTPQPEVCSSITEAVRGKADIEILNNYLTQLEKDIPLYSGTAVALDSKNPCVPLRQPPIHTPEKMATHWPSHLDRDTRPSSLGLEWFPELYPNYHRLGLFSWRTSQWDTPLPQTQVPILPCKDQQVPLAQRHLMNVRLQDLPHWFITRDLSPQGMLGATYRAWNSYCNKYINVKKSGVSGISMLLLGYCMLSYAWSYEHIKHSRWRKYH
ncbi:hypothetical protein JRQ81_002005 [Phrynocephalus forsythii]|uniref:ATP synthase subunit f, mitochondrial n=1 Tax=Phrynocephalus forsythii TaxID=171643 RepID=A0A9Q0XH49_9SAUR|nr:hypothetical protein JRQ81_002005 [Phrynocephalus forsythii]